MDGDYRGQEVEKFTSVCLAERGFGLFEDEHKNKDGNTMGLRWGKTMGCFPQANRHGVVRPSRRFSFFTAAPAGMSTSDFSFRNLMAADLVFRGAPAFITPGKGYTPLEKPGLLRSVVVKVMANELPSKTKDIPCMSYSRRFWPVLFGLAVARSASFS